MDAHFRRQTAFNQFQSTKQKKELKPNKEKRKQTEVMWKQFRFQDTSIRGVSILFGRWRQTSNGNVAATECFECNGPNARWNEQEEKEAQRKWIKVKLRKNQKVDWSLNRPMIYEEQIGQDSLTVQKTVAETDAVTKVTKGV